MPQPQNPKIYHIVHVDKLASIANDSALFSDAIMAGRPPNGTVIGMNDIKRRRLELPVSCHTGLMVGNCVPFYFCPRSVMLYLIHRANREELAYRGGQGPIVHLEADLARTVQWANSQGLRWAFTLSNAGAFYFESRRNLTQLSQINWDAVQTNRWSGNGVPSSMKEGKQAEFLIEREFPWALVERIGVISRAMAQSVSNALPSSSHRPRIEIKSDWYY